MKNRLQHLDLKSTAIRHEVYGNPAQSLRQLGNGGFATNCH